MNRAMYNRAITALIGVLLAASSASARTLWPVDGMTWYGGDFAGWQQATGTFTTIDFTEFPIGTLIDDEYDNLGPNFTTPAGGWITGGSQYPQDGFGLWSYSWYVDIEFAEPIYSLAFHGGAYWLNLYNGDTLGRVDNPWTVRRDRADVPLPAVHGRIAALDT